MTDELKNMINEALKANGYEDYDYRDLQDTGESTLLGLEELSDEEEKKVREWYNKKKLVLPVFVAVDMYWIKDTDDTEVVGVICDNLSHEPIAVDIHEVG